MSDDGDTGTDLLLVEDNHDDARFVRRLVAEYRGETKTRSTEPPLVIDTLDHVDRLADAIDRMRRRTPDVILLDLELPDSSGLETVDRMVEHAPSVPIVVLTNHDETELGVEAIRRGATEYVAKRAITAEILLQTLRYAVERKRNRRQLLDRNHRLALLNRIIRRDIRNDVSMIVGRGDQLRDRIDASDEPALEALLEAAEHLVELTDTSAALMDVLSAEDLTRQPCDLDGVLETAVATVRRERDASIAIDRVDDAADPATVYGSPMLETMFGRLLSTVIDHSRRSQPRIIVTVDASGDRASVAIAGDGTIPDTQRALLVDSATRFDVGSGLDLDLYLVATVVEDVGGEIEIDDTAPDGATVTTTFERVRQR